MADMILPILSLMNFYGTWSTWLPMCILAVVIALIINAVLLMFSKGFKITELEHYAESEILQAVATGMIAVLLIGILVGTSQIATMFLGSGSAPLCGIQISGQEEKTFDNAIDIARCRIKEKSIAIAEVQDRVTTGSDVAAKFNLMNLGLSIFGITFFRGDWVGSMFQETETIRLTNNLATTLLVGMNGISFMLLYIKNTMLSMFIPLGIFLRSFHFTRGAGALFISLGVGLYFIFPVLFVMLDPGFVRIDIPPDMGSASLIAQTLCYPTMSAAVTMLNTNAGGASGTPLAAGRLRDQLSQAYIGLILHPLVALFLTLAFVRYMMVLLGGDTYALMRMVSKVI